LPKLAPTDPSIEVSNYNDKHPRPILIAETEQRQKHR
jgi:hypothetical protein